MKKIIVLLFVIVFVTMLFGNDSILNYSYGNPYSNYFQKNNYLYYASDLGLVKYNYTTGEKNYTQIDSLKSYNIKNLVVDQNDNVWFTYYDYMNGVKLYKYDGVNFINYFAEDTLSYYNSDHLLYLDNQNNIWMGSDTQGLFKINPTTNELINYTTLNSGIQSNAISCVTQDPVDNSLWIGSWRDGISHFVNNNWVVYNQENTSLNMNWVVQLEFTSDNTLWVGCHDGLFKKTENTFSQCGEYYKIERLSKCGEYLAIQQYDQSLKILNIYYGIETVIPFETFQINYCFQKLFMTGYENTFIMHPHNSFDDVELFHPGNYDYPERLKYIAINNTKDKIWVCTENRLSSRQNGIWTYYDEGNTGIDFTKISLMGIKSNNDLVFVKELTDAYQLVTYNGNEWILHPSFQISPNGFMRQLVIDHSDRIWILYSKNFNNQLAYYENDALHVVNYQIPDNVSGLKVDEDNNIWYGTETGKICKINTTTYETTTLLNLINSWIITIQPIDSLSCYYTTLTELKLYNNGTDSVLKTFSDMNFYSYLNLDSSNNIWIKNEYGLYKYANNQCDLIYSIPYQYNSFLNNILEDRYHNMWVLTDKNITAYNAQGFVPIDTPTITNERIHITNYPNPFNPNTNIAFTLDKNKNVNMKIYNIKGQLIKDYGFINGKQGANVINWNGKDNNNKSVASGVYFIRLNVDNKNYNHKLLLLK